MRGVPRLHPPESGVAITATWPPHMNVTLAPSDDAPAQERADRVAVRILLRRINREIVWPIPAHELPSLRAAIASGEFGPAAIVSDPALRRPVD